MEGYFKRGYEAESASHPLARAKKVLVDRRDCDIMDKMVRNCRGREAFREIEGQESVGVRLIEARIARCLNGLWIHAGRRERNTIHGFVTRTYVGRTSKSPTGS